MMVNNINKQKLDISSLFITVKNVVLMRILLLTVFFLILHDELIYFILVAGFVLPLDIDRSTAYHRCF